MQLPATFFAARVTSMFFVVGLLLSILIYRSG